MKSLILSSLFVAGLAQAHGRWNYHRTPNHCYAQTVCTFKDVDGRDLGKEKIGCYVYNYNYGANCSWKYVPNSFVECKGYDYFGKRTHIKVTCEQVGLELGYLR